MSRFITAAIGAGALAVLVYSLYNRLKPANEPIYNCDALDRLAKGDAR